MRAPNAVPNNINSCDFTDPSLFVSVSVSVSLSPETADQKHQAMVNQRQFWSIIAYIGGRPGPDPHVPIDVLETDDDDDDADAAADDDDDDDDNDDDDAAAADDDGDDDDADDGDDARTRSRSFVV
jgi:hypothetical protein